MYYFQTFIQKTEESRAREKTGKFEIDNSETQSEFVTRILSKYNWLTPIDQQFLADSFNSFGISEMVDNFDDIIKLIGDVSHEEQTVFDEESDFWKSCENVYSQLHSRYILTPPGMKVMRRKFESGIFGECPRFKCEGQHVLPIGISNKFGEYKVKVYCPRCHDVYDIEKESCVNLDGAYFGPNFPHFFMQMNEDMEFPPKAEQMLFNYCGIPLQVKSALSPNKVIRDKALFQIPDTLPVHQDQDLGSTLV